MEIILRNLPDNITFFEIRLISSTTLWIAFVGHLNEFNAENLTRIQSVMGKKVAIRESFLFSITYKESDDDL